MRIMVLTFILLLIAVLLLGVRVLFVKGGRFPSTHIKDSAALRQKGIGCAAHQSDE